MDLLLKRVAQTPIKKRPGRLLIAVAQANGLIIFSRSTVVCSTSSRQLREDCLEGRVLVCRRQVGRVLSATATSPFGLTSDVFTPFMQSIGYSFCQRSQSPSACGCAGHRGTSLRYLSREKILPVADSCRAAVGEILALVDQHRFVIISCQFL